MSAPKPIPKPMPRVKPRPRGCGNDEPLPLSLEVADPARKQKDQTLVARPLHYFDRQLSLPDMCVFLSGRLDELLTLLLSAFKSTGSEAMSECDRS